MGYLAGEGLSTRAIAPIVGVSPRQAAYDREAAGVQEMHTSPARPPVPEYVDTTTGEVPGAPPARVTGLDGKAYTRPEPTEGCDMGVAYVVRRAAPIAVVGSAPGPYPVAAHHLAQGVRERGRVGAGRAGDPRPAADLRRAALG